MTADKWNGNGDWNLNPTDWSAGVSAPTTPAEIQSGTATISDGGFGEAQTLTIDSGAGLNLGDSVILNITDWLINAATWNLGGGDSVSIGTRLTNSGRINIGNSGIATSTTVTVASLTNTASGAIYLQGNSSSGATDQAILDVTDSNSAIVSGNLSVLGDADLELVTGLTKVASTGYLQVYGAEAVVSLGAGSSSNALSGLTYDAGVVDFEGDGQDGAGGTSITTTASFTIASSGRLLVDLGNGDGGSRATIGGALIDFGTLDIGNTALGAATTVSATTLVNDGAINLQGNAASGTTDNASLILSGAAPSTVTGYIRVAGDATLQFGSGGFTTIGAGSQLELDGSGAKILSNNGASSAVSTLSVNKGTLTLRGGSGNGAGGATLTTTTAFSNYGFVSIDAAYNGDGGSTATFGGALINESTFDIGNGSLGASTTVNATTLTNYGSLVLQGNAASGTTAKASLVLSGAAAAATWGYLRVAGDATLQFGSGLIGAIGAGGELELDGSGAKILTSNGASSALSSLGSNYGTLSLRGDTGYGAGGATLTTTKAFWNYNTVSIDGFTNGDGGSSATFGGVLINESRVLIGNSSLSAATTVTATALLNNGTLVIQGYDGSGAQEKASLVLSGAATTTLTGSVRVSGDATLQFGSGGITSIAAGGTLEIDGSGAEILSSNGASSGLSGLASNHGTLELLGNGYYGGGGVTLTTTTGFINYSNLNIDPGNGYGASSIAFGGVLTNYGSLNIGNYYLNGSTTVKGTALANGGTLVLQGNGAVGTTSKATLAISGAASATLSATLRVSGDATLQFGSGGITTLAAGGYLELDGSGAQILTGNGASSALSSFSANYGTLDLLGNDNYGAGGVTLTTTTSLINYDNLNIDTNNGSGASSVTFGGGVANNGVLSIGNYYLNGSTTVKATAFANEGTLVLQGNASLGATSQAILAISGATGATLSATLRVSGDATLQFGSGGITTLGAGGYLELDGSDAQILTANGASSALSGFSANYGTLDLLGNSYYGAGGVTLTTKTGFINYATFNIDTNNGFGASAITFGGALTNDATLEVGNGYLNGSTTVKATALVNYGSLVIQGNASNGAVSKASILLSGAAVTALSGNLRVSGDATLQFGSGGITSIGANGSLELDGSAANILTANGASSALAGLTENDGVLVIRGDSNLGSGGAALTTTTAFTNFGAAYIDNTSNGDGGSALSFGGAFNNYGVLDMGNAYLNATTSLTVKSLNNQSAINLLGGSSILAKLIVNGAATSLGDISIGAGSEIDVTGSNSFTQTEGLTTVAGSLVASAIYAYGGVLDFKSAIASGDGVGALNVGDQGTLEFDASVDSTHAVDFGAAYGALALGDAGAFSGKIVGFAGHDAVDLLGQSVAGLSFSGGVLTVNLSAGGTETLAFSGAYTTSSFTFASDGRAGTNILHT